MARPDFLIIGAQKCATSWLHHHLRRHPELFLPEEKDVELFSYTENLAPDVFSRWLARFENTAAARRIGDANAAYSWTETGSPWSIKLDGFNRRIPESVREYLGDELRLIISLRDPVERAVSAYLHHIHHGAVSPEQRLLDIDAPLGIVDMGFYEAHLQNWLNVYPEDCFLVLDGLPSGETGAAAALNACTDFLEVGRFPASGGQDQPVYPGLARRWRDDGVWVEEENPAIRRHLPLRRKLPVITEAGRRFVRLVDAPELARLRALYAQDQDKLGGLLESRNVRCTRLQTAGNAEPNKGGHRV